MADYLRQLFDRVTGREADRLRQRLHHTKLKLKAEKRNREQEVDRVRRLALDHGVYIYPQVTERIDITSSSTPPLSRETIPGTWRWEAMTISDDVGDYELAERP